jgi:hypothetical protein
MLLLTGGIARYDDANTEENLCDLIVPPIERFHGRVEDYEETYALARTPVLLKP